MTSVISAQDSALKIAGYISVCKDLNIPVYPPDINHSEDHFSVEGDGIRFGMGAIKNVGRGLIRTISAKRREGGPFRGLEDFLQRMDERDLSRRTVENFIKCGAMDCFGYHRSELLEVFGGMMDSISTSRKKNLEGQMGLFGMMDEEERSSGIPIPSKPELSRAELMLMEKETTGIYLSGHPMDEYREMLRNTRVVPIGTVTGEDSTYQDDQIVTVAGVVQSVKMKVTRNNSSMAYITVEDDTASIEMIAFSKVITEYGGYLRENLPVVVTGRVSLRDDKEPQIMINRARPISDFINDGPLREEVRFEPKVFDGTLYLRLSSEADSRYRKIRAILNMFPGNNQAVLYFEDTKIRRGTRCSVDSRMLSELENVLGKQNVVVK